jgi:hypothetical protein
MHAFVNRSEPHGGNSQPTCPKLPDHRPYETRRELQDRLATRSTTANAIIGPRTRLFATPDPAGPTGAAPPASSSVMRTVAVKGYDLKFAISARFGNSGGANNHVCFPPKSGHRCRHDQ